MAQYDAAARERLKSLREADTIRAAERASCHPATKGHKAHEAFARLVEAHSLTGLARTAELSARLLNAPSVDGSDSGSDRHGAAMASTRLLGTPSSQRVATLQASMRHARTSLQALNTFSPRCVCISHTRTHLPKLT
jgi:hypothetical protein